MIRAPGPTPTRHTPISDRLTGTAKTFSPAKAARPAPLQRGPASESPLPRSAYKSGVAWFRSSTRPRGLGQPRENQCCEPSSQGQFCTAQTPQKSRKNAPYSPFTLIWGAGCAKPGEMGLPRARKRLSGVPNRRFDALRPVTTVPSRPGPRSRPRSSPNPTE
jgi:hypothetical protein